MVAHESNGARFRQTMEAERPLQIVGVINAYCALLAEEAGFRALYLSGAGVANASLGLPDLGLTTLSDVLEDVRRIMGVSRLPLLVDCDAGWGSSLLIARAVRELNRANVAAMHLEDQIPNKRCGHRPGKRLVSTQVMIDRLHAAVDARTDPEFVIVARTDAVAVEGLQAAVERALRYVEAGADIVFAEALTEQEQFRRFVQAVPVPVMANMTEFGRTPLMRREELRELGIGLVLYPLSAFRAMSLAALRLYKDLRREGTQQSQLSSMQTRDELYRILRYEAYEQQLDQEIDK